MRGRETTKGTEKSTKSAGGYGDRKDEGELLALCDKLRETSSALHRFLRHGHLEKVYENGLANRLREPGINVQQQHPLKVADEDGTVLGSFVADLFVDDCWIVEIKACSSLAQ